MFNVGDTLLKLATESGFAGFFANGGWQNLVMIVIACVLLYLGIVKGFEIGLHLLELPEAYGGIGLSYEDYCIVQEELLLPVAGVLILINGFQ